MKALNLLKFGAKTIRMDTSKVTDVDTKAVYNTTGISFVETYDDVEYVTSAGVYFRQDDAGACTAARDAFQAAESELRIAAQEKANASIADTTPMTVLSN